MSYPSIPNGVDSLINSKDNSIGKFIYQPKKFSYNYAEKTFKPLNSSRVMALRRNIIKPNSNQIEGFIIYEMKLDDFDLGLKDHNCF